MPDDPLLVPPVPAGLAHRPLTGGLAVPWVNVALDDGGCDFRGLHHSRWLQAWVHGTCQTCGLPLEGPPVVLLGGPRQLGGYFDEPPLHPWCARYAARACPMVAGRLERYADRPHLAHGARGKRCPEPGCQCAGWVPHTQGSTGGELAHEWWAVWCRDWALAATPQGRLLGGVPQGELRRRLLSTPPAPTTRPTGP